MQGIAPGKSNQRTTPMLDSLSSFDGAITRPVWNDLVNLARKAGLTRVDYKHRTDEKGDASGVAKLLGISPGTAARWMRRSHSRPVYYKSNVRKVFRACYLFGEPAPAAPAAVSPDELADTIRKAVQGVSADFGKITVKIGKITVKINA